MPLVNPVNVSQTSGVANADIRQTNDTWAAAEILANASVIRVLNKFGLTKPMPKNKGQSVEFRRAKPFSAVTTPLVEGVTPASTKFVYEKVKGTLKQYGQVTDITDVVEDTYMDPVYQDAVTELGENVGRTMEALDWGVLRAGTNVYYANGTARAQLNTPVTLKGVQRVVRGLMAQKARPITRMLDSSVRQNTVPIPAAYVAVCHTNLMADLRNLPNNVFTPVERYGNARQRISDEEIGTLEQVRFLASADLEPLEAAGAVVGTSGMVSASGVNCDVYPILVFGSQAYAHVPLGSRDSVEPTVIPVSTKTKDDPLGQQGRAGWKSWHLTMILNQLWMARYEVCVSDLS